MAFECDFDPLGVLGNNSGGTSLGGSLTPNHVNNIHNMTSSMSSLSEAERLMSSFVVVPDGELTSTLLATANIGSIFEAPGDLVPEWTRQVIEKIKRLQPQFIALHCQEVGGKNFEHSMKHVDDFVKDFIDKGHEIGYTRIVAFFDKNYKASDKFTALGSLYLVHKSVQYVEIYNFEKRSFESPCGHHMHLGCIDAQPLVEKHKFPLYLFPDNRWSRKGFLRTRWRINGTILDLINIHLFHDASNLVSFETDPSVYVNYRRRALQYTLDLIQDDDKQNVPFIIFGDFNFRLDTQRVLQKLTQEHPLEETNHHQSLYPHDPLLSPRSENGNLDDDFREFRNREDQLVLSLGKKEFSLGEHYDGTFNTDWRQWASLDNEVYNVQQRLTEFTINFPPTYPFEERPSLSSRYMKTRCPAWCDRVLLSNPARELIHNPPPPQASTPISPSPSPDLCQIRKKIEVSSVLYDIIGRNACMGDHKPVFLLFNLKSNARIPIPRYSSYGIYDEVNMHHNSDTRYQSVSSKSKRRDKLYSPWLEDKAFVVERKSGKNVVTSSSISPTPLNNNNNVSSLHVPHSPIPPEIIEPKNELEDESGRQHQQLQHESSSTSPTPVVVDHRILTRYIEIKDHNRVKLFKETTV
ncbi:inositol polyphosphate-5-phosphatase A [Lepeophtheirus salmonis]|uniref:inositol polyphosphate-5-phosphatase A n=1 Tax=Lepeophtheirus salmonis TaxID=72036 RepID=UPI001AE3624D|nr:inositol polyphosphate-5-phosphatase A-like [Lepeophtheirus salmonis]